MYVGWYYHSNQATNNKDYIYSEKTEQSILAEGSILQAKIQDCVGYILVSSLTAIYCTFSSEFVYHV